MSAAIGPPSAWRVFGAGLRIGAVAFGGLGATLTLLERDLVQRRGWLTSADIRDALTYTKPLPGSTVVQVVTFLGWRLGRLSGAIAATVAFLIPSIAMMTAAAAGAAALPDTAWIRGALAGLQIAVVGVLAHTLAGLLAKEARGALLAGIAAAAAAAGFFVNAALIVIAGGLLGVLLEYRPRRHTERRSTS